ncbi:four helix bundle protein [Tepidiforma thermophila]|uniref:Four helix bundle protein n=1 Tax=Tepidiforma thermophila (strain KCTC 52669 / CGMCC 1.13589 / G233) TaxID=2761530 RepID=A0A2A9HEC5_TEPT2|nr:four helix bundle protein [Tepidiforma thermophila]PFG73492.1 four helix bundle protein [Tepidiforma thermophila]
MPELPYRNLEVWRRSHALTMAALDLAESRPVARRPALADQITRAALSIPLNIAEGRGRRTRNDFAGFLAIARGSLFELDAALYLCHCRNLLPDGTYAALHSEIYELTAMVQAMIDSLRNPK